MIALIADLRAHLQESCEPPIYVSDRRLVKAIGMLQVCTMACFKYILRYQKYRDMMIVELLSIDTDTAAVHVGGSIHKWATGGQRIRLLAASARALAAARGVAADC